MQKSEFVIYINTLVSAKRNNRRIWTLCLVGCVGSCPIGEWLTRKGLDRKLEEVKSWLNSRGMSYQIKETESAKA